MQDEIKSERVEYPTGDYHKVWNVTIPEELSISIPTRYAYGSRMRTKMMTFLKEVKFTRVANLYYESLGPARQEDEDYIDYKIRQKFQRELNRNRAIVKASIFMNMVQELRAKQTEDETKENK